MVIIAEIGRGSAALNAKTGISKQYAEVTTLVKKKIFSS